MIEWQGALYSISHWSEDVRDTERGDHARAVMREPMWKDATSSTDVSVYASKGDEHGRLKNEKGSGTHDEQYGYRVFTTNGNEIWGVGVVAGANDVNEGAVVVSEVHCKREAVTAQAPNTDPPCL